MMCTDTVGASRLLGVARSTVYLWRLAGKLGWIQSGWKSFIPLKDIAKELNTTQKELLATADSIGVDIWRVKK
jgi:predicted site-specific integrase-resolvase